jgi:hypothetical protein
VYEGDGECPALRLEALGLLNGIVIRAIALRNLLGRRHWVAECD